MNSLQSVPLILLPGMNLAANFWDRCEVARTARVHVPDGATLTEAVEVLDEVVHEPSILAGLSLGGILAMAYARVHPGKVAGLVLMATNAKAPTDAQLDAWQETVAALEETSDPRSFQQSILTSLLSPDALKDPGVVEATLESASLTTRATLIDQLKMQQTRIDERPFLSRISVPVEILAGRQDALCPVSNHEEIRDLIHGAVLDVSESSGHLIPFEDPDAVDSAVARIRHRLSTIKDVKP